MVFVNESSLDRRAKFWRFPERPRAAPLRQASSAVLASTAIDAFLTQRPSAPPELRRAPAKIPEAPLSTQAARLDLMA